MLLCVYTTTILTRKISLSALLLAEKGGTRDTVCSHAPPHIQVSSVDARDWDIDWYVPVKIVFKIKRDIKCTISASLSVVSLSLFYVRASRLDYEAPLSATAKLYSTTLLAVLNSRMNLSVATDNIVSWDCADPDAVTRGTRIDAHIQLNSKPRHTRGGTDRNSTNGIIFNNTCDTAISVA